MSFNVNTRLILYSIYVYQKPLTLQQQQTKTSGSFAFFSYNIS